MRNYPEDFIDSSVKFRNISLGQNEKEFVSGTSPIVKTVIIDYFLESIKNQNLKNPIVVSGDAPTYSTFSYTATEGNKVSAKYTRGISVITTDWSVAMKSVGDVIDSELYSYEALRDPNDPPRKIDETTYGWVEQISLEITFWAINSSRGRDIGGQYIKRTMLEGLKNFHFIKNGIISCVPVSGFDSNDTALLKTNGSILYQHVTRWNLQAFFFINTSTYEAEELISGVGIEFLPAVSGTLMNSKPVEYGNVIEHNTSGGIVYPTSWSDRLAGAVSQADLDDKYDNPYTAGNLSNEEFDKVLTNQLKNNKPSISSGSSFETSSGNSFVALSEIGCCPPGDNFYHLPVTTTTTTSTTTTTTSI